MRSPAESDDDSLDFGPRVEGQNFIRYQPSERKSVLRVIKAIDEYLQRKK